MQLLLDVKDIGEFQSVVMTAVLRYAWGSLQEEITSTPLDSIRRSALLARQNVVYRVFAELGNSHK